MVDMADVRNMPIDDQVLRLADGRSLAWATWGTADGPPVVLLHRAPGSRLFDPDPQATAAVGVRLLTLDRPGYGGTSPVSDPWRRDAALDVVALLDVLDLDDVAVIGWSGGGQFAVEAVAALEDRARSLSLVATPAPDDEVPWLDDEMRPLSEAVRTDPVGAMPAVLEAVGFIVAHPDEMAAADPSLADAELRTSPDVLGALVTMTREGLRAGPHGSAFDVVAGSRHDPLPLDRIRVPAQLWYGDQDPIGIEHARWYERRLAHATLTIIPGAGHLLPLQHWREILDAAVG
jgi:pimeloyl-ACP methyl ester carboxylesterase